MRTTKALEDERRLITKYVKTFIELGGKAQVA